MREKVQLATKFGIIYEEGKREIKGDPLYVRAACKASLKRLDVKCIDLYYQHRIDTRIPIEITVSNPSLPWGQRMRLLIMFYTCVALSVIASLFIKNQCLVK